MARHTRPSKLPQHPEAALTQEAANGTAMASPPCGRLLISVAEARAALGVGHTTLYGLLARGQLQARRLGGRTLVEAASLRDFVAALPVAKFGTTPGAANDCDPRSPERGGRRGMSGGTPG